MSVIHTKQFRIVVGTGEETTYYPIELPARGFVSSITIYSPDVAGFTFDLYSRAFSGSANTIYSVTDGSASGYSKVTTVAPHLLQAGDFITVADCHADYNGTGIYVSSVLSSTVFEMAKTFTSEQNAGTATLAIPDVYKPLWEVVPQGTASSNYYRFGVSDSNSWMPPYQCRDVESSVGFPKKLYAKFSNDETTYYGTIITVGMSTA